MESLIQFATYIIDFIIHIDAHLNELVVAFGPWVYVILFAIIFCETGLVVTPILPGDSLLFAAGAIAAIEGSPLNVWLLAALLVVAAIVGDAVNFACGTFVGPKIFYRDTGIFLNRQHLEYTQKFYERHGGKTIILARFMPIVRTFAPFVAGIGRMSYGRFALFNVTGALLWVYPFLLAGYFFGNMPAIKSNFHIVIFAIIVLSVLPGVIEFLRHRRQLQRAPL